MFKHFILELPVFTPWIHALNPSHTSRAVRISSWLLAVGPRVKLKYKVQQLCYFSLKSLNQLQIKSFKVINLQ